MPKGSTARNPRFTVTLPQAAIDQLDAIAAERGTRRATIMTEAAHFYLKYRHAVAEGAAQKRRAS